MRREKLLRWDAWKLIQNVGDALVRGQTLALEGLHSLLPQKLGLMYPVCGGLERFSYKFH